MISKLPEFVMVVVRIRPGGGSERTIPVVSISNGKSSDFSSYICALVAVEFPSWIWDCPGTVLFEVSLFDALGFVEKRLEVFDLLFDKVDGLDGGDAFLSDLVLTLELFEAMFENWLVDWSSSSWKLMFFNYCIVSSIARIKQFCIAQKQSTTWFRFRTTFIYYFVKCSILFSIFLFVFSMLLIYPSFRIRHRYETIAGIEKSELWLFTTNNLKLTWEKSQNNNRQKEYKIETNVPKIEFRVNSWEI